MKVYRMYLEIKEMLQVDLEKNKIVEEQYDLAMERLINNYPELKEEYEQTGKYPKGTRCS
mgnify:CR=1 FL=1